MRRLVVALSLTTLTFGFTSTSSAATIVWDNGSPDLSNGYFFGYNSAEFINDFSLSQSTTLTGVNFWTLSLGAPGNTYWAVYADNAGTPVWGGSPLFTGIASAVSIYLGGPVYGLDQYQNFLPINAALGPGNYWLGLGASNLSYWAPSTSGLIGQLSYIHQLTTFSDYSSGYISNMTYQEYAFNIEGQTTVPEPGSLALLAAGLAAVAVRQSRRLRRR